MFKRVCKDTAYPSNIFLLKRCLLILKNKNSFLQSLLMYFTIYQTICIAFTFSYEETTTTSKKIFQTQF